MVDLDISNKANAGTEQCMLLSCGLCLTFIFALNLGSGGYNTVVKVYILENLTASCRLGNLVTFNYCWKAAFILVVCFFFLKTDWKFQVVILLSWREVGVEWEGKSMEETESYLALNAHPRGGGQSAIFCVVSRIDCFFLGLDAYGWDQFVLSGGSGWWKSCWNC